MVPSCCNKNRPKQVDRLVVDHMLRNGHHEAAAELARETGTSDLVRGRRSLLSAPVPPALPPRGPTFPFALTLCPLPRPFVSQVDLNVHRAAREIEEDLRAHSCAKALAWCEQHRAKLKKHGVR